MALQSHFNAAMAGLKRLVTAGSRARSKRRRCIAGVANPTVRNLTEHIRGIAAPETPLLNSPDTIKRQTTVPFESRRVAGVPI